MIERGDLWEFACWLLRGIGAIVSSTLYLGAVIGYSTYTGHGAAALLAIWAAGVAFLCYLAQLVGQVVGGWYVPAGAILSAVSIVLGAIAGALLLF